VQCRLCRRWRGWPQTLMLFCAVCLLVQVAPNCKLPIFYLTDSILKNVRGPYLPLFAAKIVPLYCNCVRQVAAAAPRKGPCHRC
jgi:hypothetical protein